MSYIAQRQDRFYVVAFDDLDPLTGRERRRWHPVGHDRHEAEQLAARLDCERDATPAAPTGPVTFGEFLTNTWIPHKRRQVRATTAYRYAWFVDRYITPAIGDIPPTRRCSSPTAPRSRSCPNASVTPTQRSPCTPTNTCCRA